MNTIHSRVERLMKRIADETRGALTVTFADGHLADLLNGLLEV